VSSVMTRGIYITRHGGPEVLQIGDVLVPEPGLTDVMIDVRAVGMNFADVYCRLGLYEASPRPPFIPGFEVAGVVVAVGEHVADFEPGDRVIGVSRFGAYAECVVVPRWQVMRIPESCSFEEAAGFPAAFMTAYHGLVTLGRIRDGMTVLIHAAAGGVGTAALQLSRRHEVTIIATAGSADKMRLASELGAHHTINYRREDFEAVVRGLTRGNGVDLVLDSVGGDCFSKSYRLLRKMGHLVTIGSATMMPESSRIHWIRLAWQYLTRPRLDPLAMIGENRTVSGFNLVHLFGELDVLNRSFSDLESWWSSGEIAPVLGRIFPFSEAGRAQEELRRRKTTGKVILVPDS